MAGTESHDGCGIFWRRDFFSLRASDAVDFVDEPRSKTRPRTLRDRCALLALFDLNTPFAAPAQLATGASSLDRAASTGSPEAGSGAFEQHRDSLILVSTHLARNPEDPRQDKLRTRQVRKTIPNNMRALHGY
jgi:hypothetical protein